MPGLVTRSSIFNRLRCLYFFANFFYYFFGNGKRWVNPTVSVGLGDGKRWVGGLVELWCETIPRARPTPRPHAVRLDVAAPLQGPELGTCGRRAEAGPLRQRSDRREAHPRIRQRREVGDRPVDLAPTRPARRELDSIDGLPESPVVWELRFMDAAGWPKAQRRLPLVGLGIAFRKLWCYSRG